MYAWKEPKTQEHEDAEDMGWDVVDFISSYTLNHYDQSIPIDDRLTDDFIIYILE